MGSLLLWGIDELLTYHYLVAEVSRARPEMTCEAFWTMPKSAQADLIWQELFIKRTPVSEACRGVLTVLQALGLNVNTKNLSDIRAYFAAQTVRGYVDQVFKLAGVERVYMTNDPLNPVERLVWEKDLNAIPAFYPPCGWTVRSRIGRRALVISKPWVMRWIHRFPAGL